MKCACGCGSEANPGRQYIRSHHLNCQTEETKRRRAETRRSNRDLLYNYRLSQEKEEQTYV